VIFEDELYLSCKIESLFYSFPMNVKNSQ